MSELYDREKYLQSRLNEFVEHGFDLPELDYYSLLELDDFLKLKSILSDINNIFTLKVSLAFAHWITGQFELSEESTKTICSQILGTKPNANGFDLELREPIKVVAEVKCNIPINGGDVYGSAQRNGIAKDIDSLVNGKSKSPINSKDCFKFMVFLDRPEIRKATAHFIKNMKEHKELISVIDKTTGQMSTDKIYVTFVSF